MSSTSYALPVIHRTIFHPGMHETAGWRLQDLYHGNDDDTTVHGHIILIRTYRSATT